MVRAWVKLINRILAHSPLAAGVADGSLAGAILKRLVAQWTCSLRGSSLTEEEWLAFQKKQKKAGAFVVSFETQVDDAVAEAIQRMWDDKGLRDLNTAPPRLQNKYKATRRKKMKHARKTQKGNHVMDWSWGQMTGAEKAAAAKDPKARSENLRRYNAKFQALPLAEQVRTHAFSQNVF